VSGARGPAARGAVFGLAAALSAVVAVPAAVRVAAGGAGTFTVWLGLAGGSALLVGPFVALAASLGGLERLVAPAVGVGLVTGPVALLGATLKTTTHHRPLGAATFGALALVLVLGGLLVAGRAFGALRARPSLARRAVVFVLGALSLASFGGVLAVALAEHQTRVHLIDGSYLLLAAVVALGGRRWLPSSASAGLAGWALWGILVLGSLWVAAGGAFDQLRAGAPVLAGPVGWL